MTIFTFHTSPRFQLLNALCRYKFVPRFPCDDYALFQCRTKYIQYSFILVNVFIVLKNFLSLNKKGKSLHRYLMYSVILPTAKVGKAHSRYECPTTVHLSDPGLVQFRVT